MNVSGADLLEYHVQTGGTLDRKTLESIDRNVATTYEITYPIYFAHPQLVDPTGSFLMLPVMKYPNDPVLELTFSTQAQMDTNVSPTFAVSALAVELIVNRRIVNVTAFPYVDWDLTTTEQSFAASSEDARIELPAPGSYTGQLYRCYTSATARGDISSATGIWRIESLGVSFRRWKMAHLQIENDYSRLSQPRNNPLLVYTAAGTPSATNTIVDSTASYSETATENNLATLARAINNLRGDNYFPASYYQDFLTDRAGTDANELGSVMDANIPQNTGARIYLIGGVTGGAGVKMRVVSHRLFGNLSSLKLVKP